MAQATRRGIVITNNLWWLSVLAFLSLAALLFFSRLGERAFWGPEARWAEVAREMRASGNYFWPTIDGQVHFGKPLLSYWLIAAAANLTGGLGLVLPLLVIGVYSLLGEGLKSFFNGILYGAWAYRRAWLFARFRWLFNLKTGVAVAVGLSLYAVPFAISTALMHSDVEVSKVWTENVVEGSVSSPEARPEVSLRE